MIDFSEDAKRKTTSGLKAKELFSTVVKEQIKSLNLNIALKDNYKIGYEGMEQDQFKSDFVIEFNDSAEKWLISTTSSPRTDRMLGDQFKAEHILILDESASRYYLVLPSSISEKDLDIVASYSAKIKNLRIKSFITDVITIDDFIKTLISHAYSSAPKKAHVDEVFEHSVDYQSASGIRSNVLGKNAEYSIANTLMSDSNITLWNDPKQNYKVKSESFREFKAILSGLGYRHDRDIIDEIYATTDIPKLINGGEPKTDVMFKISTKYKSGLHAITIKNTDKKQVTIHEGNVSDLINAIGIDFDSELAKALVAFQEAGGPRNLLTLSKGSHYSEVLTKHLPKYKRQIAEFAFFGVNSPRISDGCQIPDSILYTQNFMFMKSEDYLNYYLEENNNKGTYKTSLYWTFASGRKGKGIILKCWTNN